MLHLTQVKANNKKGMIMSYLIKNDKVIGFTIDTYSRGTKAVASRLTSNGSLVNATEVKISNAKKWRGEKSEHADHAELLSSNGVYLRFKLHQTESNINDYVA